jgi:hypothetical protein
VHLGLRLDKAEALLGVSVSGNRSEGGRPPRRLGLDRSASDRDQPRPLRNALEHQAQRRPLKRLHVSHVPEPRRAQGVSWLAFRSALRTGLGISTRVVSTPRWRTQMTWRPKHLFQKRPEVVVVKISLRRIRWIEPIAGSGHWWPFPLPRWR